MKPLSSLRVVDLSRILAGPWSAQILADLGADVIKVERAGAGDDTRSWGPPFIAGESGENLSATYFHACNRGKRSLAIDFDSEQDLALVHQLIANADIVIENFKVGGLKKYGLDSASLTARYPRLIYCSITGFGQNGPYAPRPGYDALIQAMGGSMHVTGAEGGEPMKAGVPYADILTGVYSAVGMLAAVAGRNETGKGSVIDMSLLDVQVGALANVALSYLASGVEAKRLGNAHPNLVPYQVFAAKDGHLFVAVGNDDQFARLCKTLGVPDLATDPDYSSGPNRVKNRERLIALLTKRTGEYTKQALFEQLEAADISAGPINSIAEVFQDPQVVHRGMSFNLPYPASATGSVPGLRTPIIMNGAPCVAGRPAPMLGEHNQEIARNLESLETRSIPK